MFNPRNVVCLLEQEVRDLHYHISEITDADRKMKKVVMNLMVSYMTGDVDESETLDFSGKY